MCKLMIKTTMSLHPFCKELTLKKSLNLKKKNFFVHAFWSNLCLYITIALGSHPVRTHSNHSRTRAYLEHHRSVSERDVCISSSFFYSISSLFRCLISFNFIKSKFFISASVSPYVALSLSLRLKLLFHKLLF